MNDRKVETERDERIWIATMLASGMMSAAMDRGWPAEVVVQKAVYAADKLLEALE